jgi:hypothetical protein
MGGEVTKLSKLNIYKKSITIFLVAGFRKLPKMHKK